MSSFNKIILVGHLGRDPELRYTPQGVPVCSFSLATSEKKRGAKPGPDGKSEELTTWFNVTLWREKAELAGKYLSKGKLIYIEGRLSQREYQDRNGATRTSLDVLGTEINFIDGAANGASKQASIPMTPPTDDPGTTITDEDIPF